MILTQEQRDKIFTILTGDLSKLESPARETLEKYAASELREIEAALEDQNERNVSAGQEMDR
jgi:hypothetical protein